MHIIPRPQKYVEINGQFSLCDGDTVFFAEELKESVDLFIDYIARHAGCKLRKSDDMSKARLQFCVPSLSAMPSEHYSINCTEDLLTVETGSNEACFYAVQTLVQMFDVDNAFGEKGKLVCQNCYVYDFPKYPYRAIHVDVARHFFDLETVKSVVCMMSRVKLNVLHFHFCDDQGFRISIDKYPKIAEISSVRQGTEVRRGGKTYVEEGSYGGIWSKDEVRQLVEYCADRHVEVVPEFDLPGHCVALLSAYPEYSCRGEQIPVRNKWGISKDILCAGNEDACRFVEDIIDELVELFPSRYFHLGGDEVPKDRWCNCDKCRAKLSELKLSDFNQLQTYLFNRFASYLKQKGKTVIGWNDGFTSMTDGDAVMQYWKNNEKEVNGAIKRGVKVIASPFFRTYFDYPYAMTPLKKTYLYRPDKRFGANAIGVEGTTWSEHIASKEKLQFNLYPRMLALSEVAWGTNGKFVGFEKRAKHYFGVYDEMGLQYNAKAFAKKGVVKRLAEVNVFFNKDANYEFEKDKIKE